MSTIERTEINRANAQLSTGPITEEGKQKSSLNALRHGLTSQIVVMPTEDAEAYRLHLKSFTDEYDPKGATEANLVQSLADASWRLNRVAALETNLLTQGFDAKALANLSMHSQRLSRQFEKTVTHLRDLQKTRRLEENLYVTNLLDVVDMHKSRGQTYDPAADGFVFSPAQINEARRARTREGLIAKAHSYRK